MIDAEGKKYNAQIVIDPQGRYVGFMKLPHDADNIVMAYRSIARSS